MRHCVSLHVILCCFRANSVATWEHDSPIHTRYLGHTVHGSIGSIVISSIRIMCSLMLVSLRTCIAFVFFLFIFRKVSLRFLFRLRLVPTSVYVSVCFEVLLRQTPIRLIVQLDFIVGFIFEISAQIVNNNRCIGCRSKRIFHSQKQ